MFLKIDGIASMEKSHQQKKKGGGGRGHENQFNESFRGRSAKNVSWKTRGCTKCDLRGKARYWCELGGKGMLGI